LEVEERRAAESDLASYLAWDIHPDDLFKIWEELGGIIDSTSIGLAYYLVDYYGVEPIWRILTKDLIPMLVSEDPIEREEARKKMGEMGFRPDSV